MYVVAMHVHRLSTGADGINVLYYVHHVDDWVVPPDPREEPGDPLDSAIGVSPMGGNRVRSYLDVVAPDHAPWPEIRQGLMKFLLDHEAHPMPWHGRVGRLRFGVGMDQSVAQNWEAELGRLWNAAEALRTRQQTGT
jgi:hypothetical protein